MFLIEDNKDTSENTKTDIDTELEMIKQQAYNKAYSDWMTYFITQYQNVNKQTINNDNIKTESVTNNPVEKRSH